MYKSWNIIKMSERKNLMLQRETEFSRKDIDKLGELQFFLLAVCNEQKTEIK